MYKTVKELHIEIEQRLQQITSNRYGSIPPEFYDMMLNRTAIKYIQSKSNRKTNYKGEGLEDSKKRVDDFQSLKRETNWLPIICNHNETDRGFIVLPSNYLKFISSTSKLQYFKNIEVQTVDSNDTSKFKNVFYKILDISELEDFDTNLKNVVSELQTLFEDNVELPKYLIEKVYDILNDKTDDIHYDVYWEHFLDRYYEKKIIITSNKKMSGSGVYNYTDMCLHPIDSNEDFIYSENDLVASENVRATLNDFYGNRNRHKNPITELVNDKLYVYQGKDFCVSFIKVTYLKKPRLFSSLLDQMSDMTITPEFIDMVVSDILLILKDNTFNLVKQQQNIE